MNELETMNPEPQIEGFEWSDEMAEISGFHGGYERICRTMVSQGCKWLSEHQEADPVIKTYENIYGIATPQNSDAESLEIAMMDGIEDCTGAMHQASLSHILYFKQLGSWTEYKNEMIKRRNKK